MSSLSRSRSLKRAARPLWLGDNEGNVDRPYLFFPLFQGDVGDKRNRPQRPEYAARTPLSVTDFSPDGITLVIQNGGNVASDVILVEFQVIYCTLSSHGAADGFTTTHASETSYLAADAMATVDFVAARASIVKQIRFAPPITGFTNVYFRARVGTLWEPAVPPMDWSFAKEPQVTEAYYRVRNLAKRTGRSGIKKSGMKGRRKSERS